jgi:hypothetical protein
MESERKPEQGPVEALEKKLRPIRVRRGHPVVADGKLYAVPPDGPREITILVGDWPIDKTHAVG